ncbi:MAG: hypothetical protein RIQ64_643 [Actinomycetota bacterium]|jgi:hypothetical protein
MNGLQSLALNTFVALASLTIGASTEVRAIVRARVRLALACANDDLDERIAFELADVDRRSIERRLVRAAALGALALTVSFIPIRFLTVELGHQLGWSLDTRLTAAALFNLAGPLAWSAWRVRRSTHSSATI